MEYKKVKETELAELVVNWLCAQHWNVYQEVQFINRSSIADICAERNGILWIIETKTTLSIEVLNQASRWAAHYRSVAVPAVQHCDRRDYRVARDYYRVGVIEVSPYDIYEILKPPLFLHNHEAAKRLLSQLTELHKTYAKAGSCSGSCLTPYKMTMMRVKETIKEHPGCTIEYLFSEHGRMHYANKASFKGNLLICLDQFERSWCRIDKTSKPFKLYVIGVPAED